MARRLLGPEGPVSMFDQGNLLESQPLQVLSIVTVTTGIVS